METVLERRIRKRRSGVLEYEYTMPGVGLILDPSLSPNRWKENTFTTKAAVGDTVGGIYDLSGRKRHFTMSTAANEMALEVWSASRQALYVTDATDRLDGNTAALDFGKNASAIIMGLVLEMPAAFGTAGRFVNVTGNAVANTRTALYLETDGTLNIQARRIPADTPDNVGTAARTAGERLAVVYSIDYTTKAVRIVVNGALAGSKTFGWGAGNAENAAASSFTIGQTSSATAPFTDGSVGLVVGGEYSAITAAGIAAIETALSNRLMRWGGI